MPFPLSARSRDRLAGVHPDLVRVVERLATTSPIDFTVIEGLRTVERQRQLVASGASTTMNSRHLTGHAVDIAPLVGGKVSWNWPDYHRLAPAMKAAAAALGVPIEWGGDWTSFRDGPHWQLPWASYGVKDTGSKAKPASGADDGDDAPAGSGGFPQAPAFDACTTDAVNFRTAPLPAGGTPTRVLAAGTGVEVVERWALVRVQVPGGGIREGWVADRYLKPLA